ncbi:TPA: hypothetical protein DHW62_02145 [candidate division WWE3 bacterium]|uniref:HNH nuclease domain-containing protein n=1 Tax=candidate division WWE3 bacterium TaxID=2053526 RepID=A0A656PM69_UNCKA|nr:hypothetical protein P147_WWE3C00001G0775 [candidate division WWE3 bacterium RAAC2_WWE3_1]HAI95622.1 hypothetical protein [candidate division WWE3 bacterium]HBL00559.1 hypothetical protein [candidate division WWE3 bacterium]HCE36598.1 hypothetical protein [candidate division WWE3 bacterium]HCL95704.1 hypothetical protein [candidate division WWE3 bacterium]
MTKETRRYSDRPRYLSLAVSKRRRKLKMLAVEYLGNKCNLCGYNKCFAALEFHHKDGQKKDFGLASRGLTRSWETIKRELEKCVLVCSNCHKEIHNGVVQLPPETTVEKLGELRET